MPQMINYSSLLNTRIPIFDIEYLFWVLGKHYHYRSLISLSMNYLHAIYIFIHQDFYYPGFFSLHNITLGASMFWQPLPKSPHSIYLYCKPSFWCSVYKHSGNWETFQIISGALLTFHLSPSLCYTCDLSHIQR